MNANELTIGTAVTIAYPQDRYGAVITAVSKSGKTAVIQRLKEVSKSTGHAPAYFNGPYPVWDHVYSAEEVASEEFRIYNLDRITLRKDGVWRISGTQTPVVIGEARYRRDYSY